MAKFVDNSVFYCTKCGQRGVPVLRTKGKERSAGHLKKLYCLNCKEEVNHAETKELTSYSFKDFAFEFKYNNFTATGERKQEYSQLKAKKLKNWQLFMESEEYLNEKFVDTCRMSSIG